MPISKEKRALYPIDWKEISQRIREQAGNKCELCGAENHQPHPITGSMVVLTVMHLDHNPQNNDPENLKAACQRCHLNYDKEQHINNSRITRENKRRNDEGIISG